MQYVIISRRGGEVNYQVDIALTKLAVQSGKQIICWDNFSIPITIRFSSMDVNDELDVQRLPRFRRALLAWYDQNRRVLPWRKTRDPYYVWISEIMLQQTRVAAVVPRYQEFLRRFPSVQKLAHAKAATVLAEWSGLGYYHRARNVHAAAKLITQEHGGRFPQAAEAWRELPGIGRYTAAAIASIAFGEPVAVVDGNVERVLRRLLGRTNSKNNSWNAAQQLLDRERPGDFNQAIMELGATVCLPGEPLCSSCPIRRLCRTKGRGRSGKEKPRQHKVAIACALVTGADSVLLIRRAADERLMAGMWELPMVDRPGRNSGILFTVRHSITVTDYAVTVVAQPAAAAKGAKWVRISRLNQLPLTGLAKKILQKAKIIQ
jgi:A/G-specific adenine glycosylase